MAKPAHFEANRASKNIAPHSAVACGQTKAHKKCRPMSFSSADALWASEAPLKAIAREI